MVLLHLFDESQTILADYGNIPECKSEYPKGLNEISLSLARMTCMQKSPSPYQTRNRFNSFYSGIKVRKYGVNTVKHGHYPKKTKG